MYCTKTRNLWDRMIHWMHTFKAFQNRDQEQQSAPKECAKFHIHFNQLVCQYFKCVYRSCESNYNIRFTILFLIYEMHAKTVREDLFSENLYYLTGLHSWYHWIRTIGIWVFCNSKKRDVVNWINISAHLRSPGCRMFRYSNLPKLRRNILQNPPPFIDLIYSNWPKIDISQ